MAASLKLIISGPVVALVIVVVNTVAVVELNEVVREDTVDDDDEIVEEVAVVVVVVDVVMTTWVQLARTKSAREPPNIWTHEPTMRCQREGNATSAR